MATTPTTQGTQGTRGAGRAWIGISGWRYAGWRGEFYPRGLPQRSELAYAAKRLDTVEINGSFYSLQRPSSYAHWAGQVPPDFVLALKGGRFITHMKKLAGVETALANHFASGVLALAERMGPVLWQLPPNLGYDPDRLAAFFGLLPRSTGAAAELGRRHDDTLTRQGPDRVLLDCPVDRPIRHALEVRHPSFATGELGELLRAHDIGLVVADTAGRYPFLTEVTSDFVYVRLHGATELYVSGYSGEELDRWAGRVRDWTGQGLDVYVYFDNDVKVRAPDDAMGLRARLV